MERSSSYYTVPSRPYGPNHVYPPSHPSRVPKPSMRGKENVRAEAEMDPWSKLASMYAALVEQELAGIAEKTQETRDWVFEKEMQFGLFHTSEARARADAKHARRKRVLDDLVQPARARARHNTEAEKHEDRERLLREEFGRMEAKWQERNERAQRKEREGRRREEEMRRRAEEAERAEKRRIREAWGVYEERWRALRNPTAGREKLTFASIPWPVHVAPRSAADITATAVERFLLSPAHSEGVPHRERIRDALRRWHPDKFGKIASRVHQKERRAVENAVGAVARCLNELLAKEELKV